MGMKGNGQQVRIAATNGTQKKGARTNLQTDIESKITKAVNATHQTRHSEHPENAPSSSARLGMLFRGTWVPKRFYLRRTRLCCCSPRTKGGSKGHNNPLLGNAMMG